MSFREVRVFEIREVLRLWLRGEGVRATERLAGVDRKTVRRYLAAAQELGLVRDGGEEQLSDVFMGSVVEKVRPHRTDGRGRAWQQLVGQHEQLERWLKTEGLTVVKVGELLVRRGIVVPERTLHRYALEVCDVGPGRRGDTVRVNDGKPGDELQLEDGEAGLSTRRPLTSRMRGVPLLRTPRTFAAGTISERGRRAARRAAHVSTAGPCAGAESRMWASADGSGREWRVQ